MYARYFGTSPPSRATVAVPMSTSSSYTDDPSLLSSSAVSQPSASHPAAPSLGPPTCARDRKAGKGRIKLEVVGFDDQPTKRVSSDAPAGNTSMTLDKEQRRQHHEQRQNEEDDLSTGDVRRIGGRQALHVQGLSYWAPANIGPYSQAVIVSEPTLVTDTPRPVLPPSRIPCWCLMRIAPQKGYRLTQTLSR